MLLFFVTNETAHDKTGFLLLLLLYLSYYEEIEILHSIVYRIWMHSWKSKWPVKD